VDDEREGAPPKGPAHRAPQIMSASNETEARRTKGTYTYYEQGMHIHERLILRQSAIKSPFLKIFMKVCSK
jgi:hypothetical protein